METLEVHSFHGPQAERSLEPALGVMNKLRRSAEQLEVRVSPGVIVVVTLQSHTRNDDGWEWSKFGLARVGAYEATALICGAPGDVSCLTHFPELGVVGDLKAALQDLSDFGSSPVSPIRRSN